MKDIDQIPVVLCMDVEPDARILDPAVPSPWDGFSSTCALLETFRTRAAARTGSPVRFAWYLRMDPQVETVYGAWSWVVDAHGDVLHTLQRREDHVGLHVHACRWVGGRHGWLIDYGNQPWIDQCLVSAFDAFHRALGFPCTTFRFGDHWMNQATFDRLAALGAQIDLTLEPGFDSTFFYDDSEPITGVLPDYRGVPEHPYRPSATDYRVDAGTRRTGMWELPVTTALVKPSLIHRLYRRYVTRVLRSAVTPALVSHRPSVFRAIVDHALTRPQPHLVLSLRTGAVMSPAYAARIEKNLSGLLNRPGGERFTWVTPADALALLRPTAAPQETSSAGR